MLKRENRETIIECDECGKIEIRIKSIYACNAQGKAMKEAYRLGYSWNLGKDNCVKFYCKECRNASSS